MIFLCVFVRKKLNCLSVSIIVSVKKIHPLNYCSKHKNGGNFRAIKPLQIAPENAVNRISEALKLEIFRGSMTWTPLGATAFGGYLSESPFVKSWIRPRASFENSKEGDFVSAEIA